MTDTQTNHIQTTRDTQETKKSRNMTNILTIKSFEHFDDMLDSYAYASFYLPVEVLRCKNYKVEPLEVVPGSKISERLQAMPDNVRVMLEGCTVSMLESAKLVGLSRRQILVSGRDIVICKIWYGRQL